MVLRFICILFCFYSSLTFCQDFKLIGTDSNKTNFYSTNNKALKNKLFIGNDMFRFLNPESLEKTLNTFFDFLEKDSLLNSRDYERINDFTISIPINTTNKKNVTLISSKWKRDYSKNFVDSLYAYCAPLLTDTYVKYKNSAEPVFHQLFRNESRNRYGEYSQTSQTIFAIFLENEDLDLQNHRSFFQRKYSFKKLTYNEVALIESNEDSLTFAIPLISKLSQPNSYLALKIIEELLDNDLSIGYGVNHCILSLTNPNNESLLNKFINISKETFDEISKQTFNNFRAPNDINNVFFFTKDDFSLLNSKEDTLSYLDFKDFVIALDSSKKIIVINNDSVRLNDLALLNSGLGLFNKNFLMKTNSINFELEEDKNIANQLFIFMSLNNKINVNINGYALEEEYNKVSRSKIKEMIGKDKSTKSNYRLSRKTSLALLRSVGIYQELVELGIDKNRIRCNGIISNETIRSVSFKIQN